MQSLIHCRLNAGVPISRAASSVTISAAVIEDAMNEFDQELEHTTDDVQDDGELTDDVNKDADADVDADGMGMQGLDWQDEVEAAGDKQVETVSE